MRTILTPRLFILLAAALAGLSVAARSTNAQQAQPRAIPNLAGKILTVRGPIDPASVGSTLMHEHIFIEFKAPATAEGGTAPAPAATPGTVPAGGGSGGLTDYETQLAEVLEFKKAGGATIVDVTNFGLSRRPDWLERIATASGLNIVMGAGWYMRPFHPADMAARTVEELTDILVADITVGAQGTTVRSGIIGEVGVGAFGARIPLTDNEMKSIRASARASRLTGAPVTFHSFAAPEEMQRALDILVSEGVDLNRVVMGHAGRGDVEAMRKYTERSR